MAQSCTSSASKRSTTCPNTSKKSGRKRRPPPAAFTRFCNTVRSAAEERHVRVKTHVVAGHAVRDVLLLAEKLKPTLLVIGATGHSAFYERMVGSKASRIVHLAKCPVLVVK